jgi:hypothetical protein
MIKLTNLLKEVLLTECFYNAQWKAFYKRFPQYVYLIKNDPLANKNGFGDDAQKLTPSTPDDYIYNSLGYLGGTYCALGPEDFNYEGISKFFNRLVELKQITEYTKNKILALAKMYFSQYPEEIDKANKQAEIRWYSQQYKLYNKRFGEEYALKMIKKDLEDAYKGRSVTSPFASKYNITLDDILKYQGS